MHSACVTSKSSVYVSKRHQVRLGRAWHREARRAAGLSGSARAGAGAGAGLGSGTQY